MGTRGRDLCLIITAIQREEKIKGPKATRKQFTLSLYYCSVKRSLYTGNISSKTLTKWPSDQGPPVFWPRSRQLCLGDPSFGVPRLFPHLSPPDSTTQTPCARSPSPFLLPGALRTSPMPPKPFSSVPKQFPNLPLPPRRRGFYMETQSTFPSRFRRYLEPPAIQNQLVVKTS